jgi:hypothetical protein
MSWASLLRAWLEPNLAPWVQPSRLLPFGRGPAIRPGPICEILLVHAEECKAATRTGEQDRVVEKTKKSY